MVRLTTLTTLAKLGDEMARAGRSAEEEAVKEALHALARTDTGFLTTYQAAQRLSVSIPTVKRWVERGVLAGGVMGKRWLVSSESVERILRLRQSLFELDREGNPNPEEVRELYRQSRRITKG